MAEYVGTFGTRTLYLRNKFTTSLTWTEGPWSSTLTGTYKSGYQDQNLTNRATMPATASRIRPMQLKMNPTAARAGPRRAMRQTITPLPITVARTTAPAATCDQTASAPPARQVGQMPTAKVTSPSGIVQPSRAR